MIRPTLEPKPIRDVIDQVFLSPRVMDKAAFEEFSSIVKHLIERAGEAGKALHGAAVYAESVHKRLAESAPIIESRLTGAGAAIATLEARTSEVRAALVKAAKCAQRAENAHANTERIAAENVSQVEAKIAATMQNGLNTLENTRANVEVRARETAESALRAIEAAGQRLEDLEAQSAARLTEVVEQAGRSIHELEERLHQITGRIATLTGAGLGALASQCDRATAILGYDPSLPPPTAPTPGSLSGVVQAAATADPERISNWSYRSQSIDPTEPYTGRELDERKIPATKARKARLRAKAKPGRRAGRKGR